MAKVYLGIGSNMGDKKDYIDKALQLLQQHEAIKTMKMSSYYETDPVGYEDQDVFLNVVVEVETLLTPYELLDYCNGIEAKLDRKRIIRWGPRTIDIDILLYENHQLKDGKLIIPHPRMTERAFVMIPLYEIAKDIVIEGVEIKNIVDNLLQTGIRRIAFNS